MIGRWLCFWFHREITRPVHGHYVCLRCLREWPVEWSVR